MRNPRLVAYTQNFGMAQHNPRIEYTLRLRKDICCAHQLLSIVLLLLITITFNIKPKLWQLLAVLVQCTPL